MTDTGGPQVGWERIASIPAKSWGVKRQSAAEALARTWDGLVAPAMTDATAGCAASQETASSRRVRPCERANAARDSTMARFASVRRLGVAAGGEAGSLRGGLAPTVLSGQQAAGQGK